MVLKPRKHYLTVDLYFDEAKHEYYKVVNGVRVDLNPTSSINGFNKHYYAQKNMDKSILDYSLKRGKDFHFMVEMYLKKCKFDIIGSKATQSKMPNFFKWLDKFLEDKEVLLIEEPLCAEYLPIAGTPDCLLWNKTDDSFLLVDWKGGSKPANCGPKSPKKDMRWQLGVMYEPQLRIYGLLLQENFELDVNKLKYMVVFLEEDGNPKTYSF